MSEIGYLNGKFSRLEDIRLHPEDRGFLFGDGVYEVIRTYGGKPAFWADHYTRLSRSAGEIEIALPFGRETFHDILVSGIRQCALSEVKIYIQITRGVAPRDHVFPSPCEPTVFMSFKEIGKLPSSIQDAGISVVTVPDIRWGRCDIKSLNLLPNVLAKQRAKEGGVFEAIFIRENMVMEGATSNLFMVQDDTVCTPLINHQVLAGVTQQHVMQLIRHLGKKMDSRPITLQELLASDEVFLTGTTIEILPVVVIDGCQIGEGRPGLMTQKLQRKFVSLVGGERL
ncbi:MAG: D-amino-acid transaminase [Nitrospirales bacterium]|nr:D-amino-acid transaminase [Nitrospirales bacterium]